MGNIISAANPGSFSGWGAPSNEFVQALMKSPEFIRSMEDRLEPLIKSQDTISLATNLLFYDLDTTVKELYPFKELTPLIHEIPRVAGKGGAAHRWKRIVGITGGTGGIGVAEGQRGNRIDVIVQDMVAAYKSLGKEGSVPFEAVQGARGLNPSAVGAATKGALRVLLIGEEQLLINGNTSFPLGTTPTPILTAGTVAGLTGTFGGGTVYVTAVALTGMGRINVTPYNAATGIGGVASVVTRENADKTVSFIAGGSAKPSVEASIATSGSQVVTATTPYVAGAVAYAWYVGSATGQTYLAAVTASNQIYLTRYPATSNQPITNLKVGLTYQDNSVDTLVPDGVLTQIFGASTGPDPGRLMSTNPILPVGVSVTASGALVYNMPAGNTGLTQAGSDFLELDALFQAAYDQYKVTFDRILISSTDMLNSFGSMLRKPSTENAFRILFEADSTGQLTAGRTITSYRNKLSNKTLPVDVHPWVPPGTIMLWSDKVPYELSETPNILEAHTQQSYYQIAWPLQTRRYEFGTYVHEMFPIYFTPAFALITNLNPSSGNTVA